MAMDAKDLRIESALGAHTNDGSTKYAQSATALHTNGNKPYHDIGSNSLAKVDVPIARPCAIIGPDRVVPPQSTGDSYLKKASVEPWPCTDNIYQIPPKYPHNSADFPPTRNISPRQTFQENMQRIMVPPTFVSVKNNEDRVLKNTKPADVKYCDVPYTISPINIEPKIIKSAEGHIMPNISPAYPQPVPPQGWPSGSVNVRPLRPYGAPELYQYSEYPNYAGPRPISMIRPHRNVHEDIPPVYQDRFYSEANIRFKPYPLPKDRPHHHLHARYDYINNYPNTLHLHNPYVPHKYDLQKSLPPQPSPVYPPGPIKYIDRRPTPNMERYQRSPNQQVNFNQQFSNQNIPSPYGLVPGNCLQNRGYPFSPDNTTKPMMQNRFYFDSNNARKYYPSSENMYMGDMNRPQTIKNDGLYASYPHMHALSPHHMYRKDNSLKGYEHSNLRNFEYPPNLNPLSRFPLQFSPQTISISPDSNTSNDIAQALNIQEDCGYASQSSTASVKSIESGLRISSDVYRRHDTRVDAASLLNKPSQKKDNSKAKKGINVRQFLQMWNEGDDEGNDKETLVQKDPSKNLDHNEPGKNQEQLYVLGLVNVPSEELDKYNHIQKISKLPENIKGYNNIEILNQYEKLVELPSVNHFTLTPPPKQKDVHSVKNTIERHKIEMLPRPISPLDVEAKISQSVIHKEVGCNFEIRPCSPQMMNVELATPVQNVLGERLIEKVINPVVPKSPMLHRMETNNISSSGSSPKVPSCKMVHNQYISPNISDTLKTNYSLQDLESNSGVCLASLPRLDNDIEFNFPEINQQFINANKLESIRISSLRDLPVLDTENVENTNKIKNKKISEHLNSGSESDKEVPKLSKYRKHKRSSSLVNESDVNLNQNMTLHRTDSVIIKNPDNGKGNEENSHGALIGNQSLTSDQSIYHEISNPIKEPAMSNTILNSCCDDDINNTVNEKSKMYPVLDNDETAIDFSLNKNIEQGSNNCLISLNETLPINSDIDRHTVSENKTISNLDSPPYLDQNSADVQCNIFQDNSTPNDDFNRPMKDPIVNKDFSENVLNDKIDFQSIEEDNLIPHETVITHSKRKEVVIDKGSVTELATTQINSNIFQDTEDPLKCSQVDLNNVNTPLRSDIENQVLTYCLEKDSIVTTLPPVDKIPPKNSPILSHHSEDSTNCLKTSDNKTIHNHNFENLTFNDDISEKSIVLDKLPTSDLPSKDVSPKNSLSLSSDTEDSKKCEHPSNPNISQSDSPINFEKQVLDNYLVDTPIVPEPSLRVLPSQDILPSEKSLHLSYENENPLQYAKSFNSNLNESESSLSKNFVKVFSDYMVKNKVVIDKLSVDALPLEDMKPSENSFKTTKSSNASLCLSNSPFNFEKKAFNQSMVEDAIVAENVSLTALSSEDSPITLKNSPVISYGNESPKNAKYLTPKTNLSENSLSNFIEHKESNEKITVSEISCSNVVEHKVSNEKMTVSEISRSNVSELKVSNENITMTEISRSNVGEHKVLNECVVDSPNYLHPKFNDDSITNSSEINQSNYVSDIDAQLDFMSGKENNHIHKNNMCNYVISSSLLGDAHNEIVKNYDDEKIETYVKTQIHSKESQIIHSIENENEKVTQEDDEVKMEQEINNEFRNKCDNNQSHVSLDVTNTSKCRILYNKSTDNSSIYENKDHYTDDAIKDLELSSIVGFNSTNNLSLQIISDTNVSAVKVQTSSMENKLDVSNTAVTSHESLNEESKDIKRQKKLYPYNNFFKKELFSPWFQKLLFYTEGYCLSTQSSEGKISYNEVDYIHTDNANFNFSANRFVKEDMSEPNQERIFLNNEKSTETLAYEIMTKEDKHLNLHIDNDSNNIEQIKATLFDVEEVMDPENFIGKNSNFESSQEFSDEQIDESKTVLEDKIHLNLKYNNDAIKNHSITEPLFTKQFPNRRSRTLKRSLSESAASQYSCSNSVKENFDNNCVLEKKRTKLDLNNDSEILMQSQMIAENFTSFIQNNRRNSISTIYNDENVSFCIVFDNDCVLTEENEEVCQKVCYTEIPSDCLTSICTETEAINSVLPEDISCEDNKQCEYENELILQDMEERTIEETWVEDVACMETVYSDDIAEDIVISAPPSSKSSEASDDEIDNIDYEYNNVNANEHTNKIKNIYGNKMCDDDAQLVEKLYRTPQMDVTKTLIDRESRLSDEYNRYYDNESLEKVLSESNIVESQSLLNDYSEPLISISKICGAKNILSCASGENINRHEEKIKDLFLEHKLQSENLLGDLPKIVKTKLSHQEKKDYDDEKEISCDENFCESSCDNLASYENENEKLHYAVSSSPEVSSTTPEEKSSAILLKIRRYKGTKISEINEMGASFNRNPDQRYNNTSNGLSASRPLITKAAQKYIPPLKETIRDLKVKLHLPQQSLYKLQQLKKSKEEPKINTSPTSTKQYNKSLPKENNKKTKPKFEDVLKNIDEIQIKMHREKNKKSKQSVPKVIIKKNENGAHYTSTETKETFNPDLTGRKWQPWVFLEKSNFIDKMALKQKFKAIYSHRKKTYVLAESFRKYKSISNSQFVISHPNSCDSISTGKLKYTFKLKHK